MNMQVMLYARVECVCVSVFIPVCIKPRIQICTHSIHTLKHIYMYIWYTLCIHKLYTHTNVCVRMCFF